ncbi:RagB/SusD family nutrient uptake outer membrane protein [Chitinophaga arvensicola]|uniref:Starch-binding associating with outer membrane n=1 Tax=Chitinophaga arvensicola TaxID=29529 RepID=A0A1I0S9T8_9BACT|nr:RagB/SusD family nutrient uptake outer membrane protein [Chitinophaga arvensicola]SEW52993.1 Starch-binding associating with outer membrane [Chitinophaga arvensicola]
MKYSFSRNKKRKAAKWLLMACLCGVTLSGCKKLLDVDSSHTVAEKNMWNTHEDTRSALIGVYGLTRAALADNNAFWMYGELRKGDFAAVQRQDLDAVINNNLHAPLDLLNQLSNWRRFYAVVNAANLFLEHVGEVKAKDPRYSDQNMNVDIAQIRFLRAFAYFTMVRVWGDVPLITTSHDGEFINQPRTSQQKVLAFVEQELQAAADALPYGYSNGDPLQQGDYYAEGGDKWNGVLARKLSAYALMAHVAAWQAKYSYVAAYTKFVLDNAQKSSLNFLRTERLTASDGFFSGRGSNNFINNHMIAFDFQFSNGEASYTGHLEELTLALPVVSKSQPEIYVPKDTILALFDQNRDERFSLDSIKGEPTSTNYFTSFDSHVPIFSKIKVILDGGTIDPDFRMYGSAIIFTRMEDMALLRAEALAVLGDKAGATDLLNQIRDLRVMERYDATKEPDLVTAIFRERHKELMGEGWRWFDLIRYHKLKRDDATFNRLIDQGGIYWPIAESVLSQNKQLTQNAYWINK